MNGTTSNISIAAQSWTGELLTPVGDSRYNHRPSTGELCRQLERAEGEAQFSAAALDLIDKLAQAIDLQHAAITLVGELQEYFGCQRVAFGICGVKSKVCRLAAVSGLGQFDNRSEFVRTLEAAFDECVLNGAKTIWPAPAGHHRHALLTHQRLAAMSGTEKVIGVPLRNPENEAVGALIFMGVASLDRPAGFQALLRVCEGQLGNWIELVRRAQPGPVSRLLQRIRAISKSWRWKAGVIGVALIAAILAIPFTYKIKCDCQVQPHTRRFVVAPFEGRLEESLVRQGELVRQGQVLARMDGREIRLDLAAVAAERSRAGKKRDSAMATQKVADAQAAKLEMDRLDLKIQLLEQRIDNLEVRSPIDGVVISGDLERAEGAPLSIGQTLFEVAPLDKMIVELAIPEEEIWYVGENLNATVHLDAYPQHEWTASITKIHPRAEVRQSRNAFIGELQVENNGGTLRPGMNGKAKIAGPRRALAWNLFHKPADWLARTLEF